MRMKLRKATATILIISAALWLTIGILGLLFGLSFKSSLSTGEGIGFLFAAIFIVLFEVIGFFASALAALFALFDVLALIALAKARKVGWLVGTGILCLLFGSPIAGVMMCVIAHNEKPRD